MHALELSARLGGFDEQGLVYLESDRVIRAILPGHGPQVRAVLETVLREDLFRLGIVRTRETSNPSVPGGPFDLVLEHERLPFISYPHEWPASMLKDAALFHIRLFLELAPYGLTLKDMHPLNIVFDGPNPVFVDFTSIIPIDALPGVPYLQPAARPSGFGRRFWDWRSVVVNEMFARMYVPYFLRPLLLMHQGRHADAHRRMFETTLNTSTEVISAEESLGTGIRPRLRDVWHRFTTAVALVDRSPAKARFFRRLERDLIALDVSPPGSGYVDFYAAKGEDFPLEPGSAWTQRQRTVYAILERVRPASVLDVAGNTGWFSKLAALTGARVTSFDIDEASADRLYQTSLADGSGVLSLVMDVRAPTPQLESLSSDSPAAADHTAPLLLAAADRLRSDLVLALALVHHLALGQNVGFSEIVSDLERFAGRFLVVEFVDRSDQLIVAEPDFFPAMSKNPSGFDWYTLAGFEAELRRRFASVERLPSHPESRTILFCSR